MHTTWWIFLFVYTPLIITSRYIRFPSRRKGPSCTFPFNTLTEVIPILTYVIIDSFCPCGCYVHRTIKYVFTYILCLVSFNQIMVLKFIHVIAYYHSGYFLLCSIPFMNIPQFVYTVNLLMDIPYSLQLLCL